MTNCNLYKSIQTATLAFLLLSACAGLPLDKKKSGSLHQEAIQMTALGNYPDAIAKYSEATIYNPQDSLLYLHKAEVLELMQQFAEASRTYQLALDRLPPDHIHLELIHYRLGLLQARNQSKHRQAKKNLAAISEKWMQLDLKGMISLYTGKPVNALRLFSQAVKLTSDFDEQARIYYHASLAHYQMDDIAESKHALFNAVNNASSLALKEHIKIFFDELR